jgi:hypothetical protein
MTTCPLAGISREGAGTHLAQEGPLGREFESLAEHFSPLSLLSGFIGDQFVGVRLYLGCQMSVATSDIDMLSVAQAVSNGSIGMSDDRIESTVPANTEFRGGTS